MASRKAQRSIMHDRSETKDGSHHCYTIDKAVELNSLLLLISHLNNASRNLATPVENFGSRIFSKTRSLPTKKPLLTSHMYRCFVPLSNTGRRVERVRVGRTALGRLYLVSF